MRGSKSIASPVYQSTSLSKEAQLRSTSNSLFFSPSESGMSPEQKKNRLVMDVTEAIESGASVLDWRYA